MVSLWGSNKSNGQQDGDNMADNRDHDDERNYDQREPDERSRLLPSRRPPPNRDGFLDPDDPAVSPYNLWSVRFLRYLTIIFLAITFIWWILLFVALFVSPPGLSSRGSGFFDFSYTTLTAGNLLVALLFFTSPSRANRVSVGIVAGLLLVDVILIAAVGRIRLEEGWIGIASVIWAALMALWCAVTDRVVDWGKREEEERLTGRPETRRTLKEWLAIFSETGIFVIFILIVILMTATLTLRALDAGLEMDGSRYSVDGGKYQVHLACIGEPKSADETTPTLLLEAGESPVEYDLEHWAYSAYQNGTISRYCYWDRPGYAWSDNAPSPHSAGMSADAFSEALALSGEEGPWILVSGGYGSIVSRIFSARHLRDVVGMMLVDPLHEDLLHRVGSPTRGFFIWGWGVLSPLGIRRLIGALFEGQTREDRVYGSASKLNGKFLKAQLQENLVADSLTKSEVITARTIQSEDMPFVLITSGIEVRRDKEWEKKQEDLSKLTKNLIAWEVVKKAPHQVWQTPEGRQIMGERLGDLVKAASQSETIAVSNP